MRLDTDEMNRIAEAWIQLYRVPEGDPDREIAFWSHERLRDLVREDPEAAWDIIRVISREESDVVLSNLAAGPLEDLLVSHGERFIDRIEMLAAHDPQFRKMLAATWQNSMPPHLWKRIKAVAGSSW